MNCRMHYHDILNCPLTGEYACLRVDLIFKREFSYYLIQYYIPCCMLVIVSWVSFWLDQNAVPARVALGVTTLLTMSTQTSSINQSLPPVSYTKVLFPLYLWTLLTSTCYVVLHRWIFLSSCWFGLQEGVLILLDPVLHPLLYARHRFLGQLLVRPKCSSCPSIPRSNYTTNNVDADVEY